MDENKANRFWSSFFQHAFFISCSSSSSILGHSVISRWASISKWNNQKINLLNLNFIDLSAALFSFFSLNVNWNNSLNLKKNGEKKTNCWNYLLQIECQSCLEIALINWNMFFFEFLAFVCVCVCVSFASTKFRIMLINSCEGTSLFHVP